jgi:hypothetical protein
MAYLTCRQYTAARLAFAEAEAPRRGYCDIRLYTHETMTENQRLYAAIGYAETGRGVENGYERVYMRMRLPSRGASRANCWSRFRGVTKPCNG